MVYSNSYSHRLYPSYDSGMTHMWGNLRSSGIWKPLLGRWSCKYTITVYHAGVWLVLGYIFFFLHVYVCIVYCIYLYIYIIIHIYPSTHPSHMGMFIFPRLKVGDILANSCIMTSESSRILTELSMSMAVYCHVWYNYIYIYIPTGTVCCPDPQLWC